MWTCDECGAGNLVTSDFCSVCGKSPDGNKHKPKPIFSEDAVGVTRRFSVGTFLIMSVLFGVLFSVMTLLNVHPIVFGCIAVFFTGIGISQMFSDDPRRASWIAGFPLGFACGLLGSIIALWNADFNTVDQIIGSTIACTIFGGPCGYLAGCLIAGIFLVREREEDTNDDDANTFEDGE